VYSVATLTEPEARQVAEAYVKGERDPVKMALLLGVDSLDLNVVMHPLTRRFVVMYEQHLQRLYSLEDHAEQLKKIRDAAFNDDNWRIALLAETQLGKAAGLYDPKALADDQDDPHLDPAVIPNTEPDALPPPEDEDDEELDIGEDNEI
jgi:hypothetical protein